jgi:hypothetical protein
MNTQGLRALVETSVPQSLPPDTPTSIDDRFTLERRSYLDDINAAAAVLCNEIAGRSQKRRYNKKYEDPAAHQAYLKMKTAYYRDKKNALQNARYNKKKYEDPAAHRAYLERKKAYDRDRNNATPPLKDPIAHRAYLDRKKVLYATRDPAAHRAYLDKKKSRYYAAKMRGGPCCASGISREEEGV